MLQNLHLKMLKAFRCLRAPTSSILNSCVVRPFSGQVIQSTRILRIPNSVGQCSRSATRNLFTSRTLRAEKFEVDTKVAKDVILFKYENRRLFKMLNLFAVSQFLFWSYLTYCAASLRNIPVKDDNPNRPWWQSINLGEKKYKIGLMIVSFVIGKSYF
jgi:TMEM70/TMEM186/TMEM223 protein family